MSRYYVKLALSEEDRAEIEKRARKARLPLATWCRQVLIREIERGQ